MNETEERDVRMVEGSNFSLKSCMQCTPDLSSMTYIRSIFGFIGDPLWKKIFAVVLNIFSDIK